MLISLEEEFFSCKRIFLSFSAVSYERFSALLFSALTAMAEIPALYAQRPIVLRHEKAALYHPFVEALALTLVDIPISAGIITVFSIIIYFMVGLQLSAAQYL